MLHYNFFKDDKQLAYDQNCISRNQCGQLGRQMEITEKEEKETVPKQFNY